MKAGGEDFPPRGRPGIDQRENQPCTKDIEDLKSRWHNLRFSNSSWRCQRAPGAEEVRTVGQEKLPPDRVYVWQPIHGVSPWQRTTECRSREANEVTYTTASSQHSKILVNWANEFFIQFTAQWSPVSFSAREQFQPVSGKTTKPGEEAERAGNPEAERWIA